MKNKFKYKTPVWATKISILQFPFFNSSKVWLPADASDFMLQSALNDLWSIKPDSVQVTSKRDLQSYIYTITFVSARGKLVLHLYYRS